MGCDLRRLSFAGTDRSTHARVRVLQPGRVAGELGYERAAVKPRMSVSDPAYSMAEARFADEPPLDGELQSVPNDDAQAKAGSHAEDGAAAGPSDKA